MMFEVVKKRQAPGPIRFRTTTLPLRMVATALVDSAASAAAANPSQQKNQR